ncbi:MAG: ABC transporter substrate-binding protein [Sulfitobacter sp.]
MTALRTDLLNQYSNPNGTLPIGISANSGLHTNELIGGVCLALHAAVKRGSPTASRVRLVWKNDGRDPDIAQRVASAFVSEGVNYVIGHLSASASVAASSVYAANQVVFLAPGTSHPDLCTPEKRTVYRVCAQDGPQAQALTDYAMSQLNASEILIIVQDIAYGHSLCSQIVERLENAVVPYTSRVVANDHLNKKDVARCLQTGASAVVILCAIHEFAAQYLKDLRASGYTGPIIVGDDCHIDNFRSLADNQVSDVYLPQLGFASDPKSEKLRQLHQTYLELMDVQPGAYFETSYVAMETLLFSLDAAQSTTDLDIDDFLHTRSVPTLMGELKFDHDGNAIGIGWNMQSAKTVFPQYANA